jgi:hypothetical protein
MPYGDGTGPMGYGPRGGRRGGFCGGYQMPGYMNNTIPRRGIGYFMRDPYWRGFHCYYPNYEYNTNAEPREFTKDEQKKILEAELKDIEMEKENIEKRLKELE